MIEPGVDSNNLNGVSRQSLDALDRGLICLILIAGAAAACFAFLFINSVLLSLLELRIWQYGFLVSVVLIFGFLVLAVIDLYKDFSWREAGKFVLAILLLTVSSPVVPGLLSFHPFLWLILPGTTLFFSAALVTSMSQSLRRARRDRIRSDDVRLEIPIARHFKIGVVDYLNMQPLVFGLDEALGDKATVLHAPPSKLAAWLEDGTIDVGMVPVASLLAHPDWKIVRTADGRGSMIGARGEVKSVLILGGGPASSWRKLRPDSHSMTSNALARIILENKHGLSLDIGDPIPPDNWEPPATPSPGEAIVLIGSRALRHRNLPGWTVMDLGTEWFQWTELPMVFAVWAARSGVETRALAELLERHKEFNRHRLPEIAAQWRDLEYDRLTPQQALDYFLHNIDHDLTGEALDGLEIYQREGARLGIFDKPIDLASR